VAVQEVTNTRKTISKAEGATILRRGGYSLELIREIEDQLDDPIDIDRDAQTLSRYGVTRDQLIDSLGGSP
jgi:hypothetical protein